MSWLTQRWTSSTKDNTWQINNKKQLNYLSIIDISRRGGSVIDDSFANLGHDGAIKFLNCWCKSRLGAIVCSVVNVDCDPCLHDWNHTVNENGRDRRCMMVTGKLTGVEVRCCSCALASLRPKNRFERSAAQNVSFLKQIKEPTNHTQVLREVWLLRLEF